MLHVENRQCGVKLTSGGAFSAQRVCSELQQVSCQQSVRALPGGCYSRHGCRCEEEEGGRKRWMECEAGRVGCIFENIAGVPDISAA